MLNFSLKCKSGPESGPSEMEAEQPFAQLFPI